MNDKYSNVFKVIGIISVVMFVLMGLLTFFVDKYGEEATTEEAEPTKKVSLDGKDNKKKEGEVVVNEPLETDPCGRERGNQHAGQFRESAENALGKGTEDTEDVIPPCVYG